MDKIEARFSFFKTLIAAVASSFVLYICYKGFFVKAAFVMEVSLIAAMVASLFLYKILCYLFDRSIQISIGPEGVFIKKIGKTVPWKEIDGIEYKSYIFWTTVCPIWLVEFRILFDRECYALPRQGMRLPTLLYDKKSKELERVANLYLKQKAKEYLESVINKNFDQGKVLNAKHLLEGLDKDF